MSDKSATPILIAGGVGTVILLGIAWMYASSAGEQARIEAASYAERKAKTTLSEAVGATDTKTKAPVAEVSEKILTEADAAAAADSEAPKVKIEEPVKVVTKEVKTEQEDEITDIKVVEADDSSEEVAVAEAETQVEPAGIEAAAQSATTDDATAESKAADSKVEEPVKVVETDAKAEQKEEITDIEVVEVETDDSSNEATAADASTEETATTAIAVSAITGDAAAGAKAFRKCKACHKIGDGAKHAVGPNLTGIIGRVQGSADGYKYSDSFKAAMAEGKVWTPEELKAFLTKPKEYMPGTKMNFGGLRKEKDRENIIAYMNEASGN